MTRRKRNSLTFNLTALALFLAALMGPGAIDRALTMIGL
jgi:hypothetical protein